MYKVNKNSNIIPWDVDDTLVMLDPVPGVDPIVIENYPYKEKVWPNKKEIESLKMSKVRGHYVRVHSQGGHEWAEMVVIALGLQEYVDDIETKPKYYHDDLDANVWMKRYYHDPHGDNK